MLLETAILRDIDGTWLYARYKNKTGRKIVTALFEDRFGYPAKRVEKFTVRKWKAGPILEVDCDE